KLEAVQKISQTGRFRQQLMPLSILLIQIGSAAVLLSHFEMVKDPTMGKKLGDELRFVRQRENQDLRAISFHLGAFDRTVIEENETIESELELLGQRFEIFGFRLPIDTRGQEMFTVQRHIQTALEYLNHVWLVVLAAQAQEHARCVLRAHELLQ